MKSTKEQKGITLIALVVTIIVLLILAGIAVLMVTGDNSVINKAAESKEMTEQAKEEETMKLAVQDALAEGKGEIDLNGTGEGSLKKALQKEGINSYFNGIITLKNKKKYIVDNKGNIKPITSSTKQWKLKQDNDNDEKVSVGDLLAPTVTTVQNERFYVISVDNNYVTLLAQRRVDKNSNKQTDNMSTTEYGDNNIYNGSLVQEIINNYVQNLTGLDLEDVEVAYNTVHVNNVKGRILWYQEADSLKTSYSNMIYGTSSDFLIYWIGPDGESNTSSAYFIYGPYQSIGSVECSTHSGCGVRPVIKILKSYIE